VGIKPVTFMSPARAKEIKQEIRELERMIDPDGADDGAGSGVGFMKHTASQIADAGQIHHEIKQKRTMLKKHTPQKFASPKAANAAFAWAKKAEKWIINNMPDQKNHREFYPKGVGTARRETNFEQAIQNELQWQKKSPKIVEQYRYIMQRLDPSNQNAGNIERLRRGQ